MTGERDDGGGPRRIDADFPSQWFDLESLLQPSLCESILFRRECASTNSLALELATTADSLPLLVVTDCQTAGRGRGRNTWWAREGALTFSLLLEPETLGIAAESWPLVSLGTAIAVADTLAKFANESEVGLKWPNDVHLAGKKICGILVEPAQGAAGRLVIGVGVNVLNSLQAAPDDVRGLATSILDETGNEFSPGEFLTALLSELTIQLRKIGDGQLDLKTRWATQCVLTGRQISLESGDHLIEGRCTGIDTSGAILVETNGETKPWFGGVVRATD